MPAKANNSAAIAKSDRLTGNSNSKSTREPSLRDLRRRLVGFRYDLLRRLMVTLFVIGSAGLLASHLDPWRLAAEYPAATADSRVAMGALAVNARDAIGHGYNRAAAIFSAGGASVTRRAAGVGTSIGAVTHSIREEAHHALRKGQLAPSKTRGVLPHRHESRETANPAAPAVTAASSATSTAGDWLEDTFPGELGSELDKAYYKFLNFTAGVIELDWAPGLRDSISSSMQSATDRVTSGGGFSVSDLISLLKSIAESNALIAFVAGFLMFTLMLSFSTWLKRAAGH
jgi:hypothetical protein